MTMTAGPSRTQTTLTVSSPAFEHRGEIPVRHTCKGEDVSPALVVAQVPADTRALAIILFDPEAPGGRFDHWLVWNLRPGVPEIPTDADVKRLGGREGMNDFGRTGYSGPCPPPGDAHPYYFTVHALSAPLGLDAGSSRQELEREMEGKVLAQGGLMGTFARA